MNVLIDFSHELGNSRDQHSRPACLAFACSDLNAHNNKQAHLSVEYLFHHAAKQLPGWSPNSGLSLPAVIHALKNAGQPSETLYPYHPSNYKVPYLVPPAGLTPLFYSSCQTRQLTKNQIFSSLMQGKSVGLIVQVMEPLYRPTNGVIEYTKSAIPKTFHALIAVGLGVKSDEHYFLVRNSWGSNWANDGHAWLPVRYLDTHISSSFLLG